MAKILIIDDDRLLNETLCDLLTKKQHDVASAYSLAEGLAAAEQQQYDVIFLDVLLPDGNGLDIIPRLKESPSEPEIIIMTGRGDEMGAEIAVQHGAWCYIEKTTITRELILPLTRALQYREEKRKTVPVHFLNRGEIIGSSGPIDDCLKLVANAASSDVNVLIRGETGTGKEVFASTIHQNSSRAGGNFVVVDCASLPASLVESILFGHVKGAYTGADVPRKGLIHQANGGTLFLDEVGELPVAMQKAFLRVLQERSYRPVGSVSEEKSDFRLIAATNRDLEAMVAAGAFREDLLYRIRSLDIVLPPLRDRGNDIQLLAEFFVDRYCRRYGQDRKNISPEFAQALLAYQWPGNVRELANVVETVVAATPDNATLYPRNLPEKIHLAYVKASLKKNPAQAPALSAGPPEPSLLPSWKEYRDTIENLYLQKLLHQTSTIKEACLVSGLSKARIYQLINKHNLHSGNRDIGEQP